jgi:Na+-driven multidrug efflux pump
MSTTQFIGGTMTLFSNLLKAIKKPILSMIGSIFFTLILRLIWLYTIFPLNPTLETYYIVYPITWFICAVVFAIVGIIMLRKIQLKEERLEA